MQGRFLAIQNCWSVEIVNGTSGPSNIASIDMGLVIIVRRVTYRQNSQQENSFAAGCACGGLAGFARIGLEAIPGATSISNAALQP